MKCIHYNPGKKPSIQGVYAEIDSFDGLPKHSLEFSSDCFTVYRGSNISLSLSECPLQIDAKQLQQIEDIWSRESARRPLFNGKVVSYLSHGRDGNGLRICCFVADYKYLLAQIINQELDLGIRPLAVSGLLVDSQNQTLFATRKNVSEYSGYYEFVPSGGLDAALISAGSIDFTQQLKVEFEEETGICADNLGLITAYCLVFDAKHRVYDIGCVLNFSGSVSDLAGDLESEEYESFHVSPLGPLLIPKFGSNWVPTSRVLLNNYIPR